MIRYVFAAISLTAIYALALTSLDPLDLLAGLLIASSLLFVAHRRGFARRFSPSGDLLRPEDRVSPGEAARRFLAFFPFALAVAGDTARGAWRVLLMVLGARPPRGPGMVAVPLGDRTPEGVAVTAFVAAFSPGTLLVRVDEEEGVMWLHAIDAEDPDAIRRVQQNLYERYQRKVFP